MAKLEIPSIVVHSGSPSVPGVSMERSPRQPLRKQKSSLDDGEPIGSGCIHHSNVESTGPAPSNNSSHNNKSQQSPKSSSENSAGGGGNTKTNSGNQNAKSDDTEKTSGAQPQLSRSRSNGKMKMLTRSHAMREATSPPPDPAVNTSNSTSSAAATSSAPSPTKAQSPPVTTSNGKINNQSARSSNGNSYNHNNNGNTNNNNNKSKNGNSKGIKERNSMASKRGDHRQNNSNNNNVVYMSAHQESWAGLLCRDNSTDSSYQDSIKADLDSFIAQQMSTKNRPLLLKVEDELKQLAHNPRLVYFRFPQMSSFHRMLVHRAASYFGMDHNLDASQTCVVVNRCKITRVPEKSFLQIMREMKGLHNRAYSSEEPRKSILKRDYGSFEDGQYKSDEKQLSLESRRSKSFDERAEEYERARRRIFSRDDSSDSCHRNSDSNQDSMEDVRWNECATWTSGEPEPPGKYLRPNDRTPRLLKTESYESRESAKGNSTRSGVSKSYSFGGYTGNASSGNNSRSGPNHGQSFSGLHRGDSNASSVSTGSRMLAKQDSGSSVSSSRLSPSSSGYKSQSQQSDATLSATPSPTATPLSLLPMSSQGSQDTLSPEPPVIWPMTAMGNIPRGSVLINPATGQPICNADGSVYRYDPENPLTLHVPRPSTPVKQTTANQVIDKGNLKDGAVIQTSQSDSSLKISQTSASSTKLGTESEDSQSTSQQSQAKAHHLTPQYEKSYESQTGKPSLSNDKVHELNQQKYKDSSQERRSNQSLGHAHSQAEYKKSEAAISNLTVPSSETNTRVMSNAATSPMLLQSPQRQLPAQAGQPIVVPALGYSVNGSQPQQPVQMMPVMSQVTSNAAMYPVQANGVPQYPNGSYVPGYTSPDGQTFINGYPYMSHVGSYPVNVDPSSGTFVSQQQQPSGPNNMCPQGAPCCAPGYPCPYSAQVLTTCPPPPSVPSGPHTGYEQRNVDATGQSVNELSNYMMGMTVNGNGQATAVDQRAGGDIASSHPDGHGPQQGPSNASGHQTPHVMVAGGSSYYWGPQLSSHNQGYPPTVMYYYPPNNVTSPQNSGGSGSTPSSSTIGAANNSNSSYNRGTSPSTNSRESNKNNLNPVHSASSSMSGGSNRNNSNRNVAASYAKGAAIYQPPAYSIPGPNMQVAQQAPDRTVINGYANDCVAGAAPQQPVVYTVSSMHSSTVPTQSYQPSIYSSANTAMAAPGNAPPTSLAYYSAVQGGGDSSNPSQGQQLMSMNPYAGPQGYIPAAGTPPLTPNAVLGSQGCYGVPPYMYSVYSQGPSSPAPYPNVSPHQSTMMRGIMRPNLMVGGVQSSPPPRGLGSKGFPRGQSPVSRKDQSGSADNIRFSQPYSVPMYNIAASRYMSGDMRYMPGRLPFSVPTNNYHRTIRPFQTSYFPRPHSQPSGEAFNLARPPRARKPTSTHARSPAGGPNVGNESKAFSKTCAVMTTS